MPAPCDHWGHWQFLLGNEPCCGSLSPSLKELVEPAIARYLGTSTASGRDVLAAEGPGCMRAKEKTLEPSPPLGGLSMQILWIVDLCVKAGVDHVVGCKGFQNAVASKDMVGAWGQQRAWGPEQLTSRCALLQFCKLPEYLKGHFLETCGGVATPLPGQEVYLRWTYRCTRCNRANVELQCGATESIASLESNWKQSGIKWECQKCDSTYRGTAHSLQVLIHVGGINAEYILSWPEEPKLLWKIGGDNGLLHSQNLVDRAGRPVAFTNLGFRYQQSRPAPTVLDWEQSDHLRSLLYKTCQGQ